MRWTMYRKWTLRTDEEHRTTIGLYLDTTRWSFPLSIWYEDINPDYSHSLCVQILCFAFIFKRYYR